MAENDKFPLLSRVVIDKPPQPPKLPTSPILPPKAKNMAPVMYGGSMSGGMSKARNTPKAEVRTEQIQTTLVSSEEKTKHYAEKVLNFLAIFIIVYVTINIAVSVYMLISVNMLVTDLYSDMLYSEAAEIFDSAYTATSEIIRQLTESIFGAAMAELIVLMTKRVIKDNDGLTVIKNAFSRKSKVGEPVDLEDDIIEGADSADPGQD